MSRWFCWSILLACVLLRVTPPWGVNHDCGWYLYVADRVLAGDVLYVDLVDLNPPMATYLSLLPVALARVTGFSAVVLFDVFVLAVLFTSVWVTGRIARRGGLSILGDPRALSLVAFGFASLPAADFGQREHLLAMLVLPYFTVAATRWSGGCVSSRGALFAGVLAGVGFALKPYLLLAPLLVRSAQAIHERRFLSSRRLENSWMFAVLVVYAAHVFVLPNRSAFLDNVFELMTVYGAYEIGLADFFGRPWSRSALALLVVSSLGLLSRDHRRFFAVFVLAQLGFLLGALWQAKGWSYHLLPSLLFGWLGVFAVVYLVLVPVASAVPVVPAAPVVPVVPLGSRASLVSSRISTRAPDGDTPAAPRTTPAASRTTPAAPRTTPAVFALLAIASVWVVLDLGRHWLSRDPEDGSLVLAGEFTGIPTDLDVVRELQAGDALVVLDTDMHTFFAWMAQRGILWASRYAYLWPLPGADAARAQELRGQVFADLARYRPRLVLVRKGQPSFVSDPGFDVMGWLGSLPEDPAFREAWSPYDRIGDSERFVVWRRVR